MEKKVFGKAYHIQDEIWDIESIDSLYKINKGNKSNFCYGDFKVPYEITDRIMKIVLDYKKELERKFEEL